MKSHAQEIIGHNLLCCAGGVVNTRTRGVTFQRWLCRALRTAFMSRAVKVRGSPEPKSAAVIPPPREQSVSRP